MENWDDRRMFLALSRSGSIKAAARTLGVNRSTVLRRLNTLEERLGAQLFIRTSGGYILTVLGEELKIATAEIEERITAIDRRISGKDSKPHGTIRVSIAGALAGYVLMPDLALFSQGHPQINLEILTTFHMTNLAQREADIAIRISNTPPEDLVGRRLVRIAKTGYTLRSGKTISNDFIGFSLGGEAPQPRLTVVADPYATIRAIKAGLGYTTLPCFMGDQEPELKRLEGHPVEFTDLWILTHPDMRDTARVRVFVDFFGAAIKQHKPLLEGQKPIH